MLVVSAKREKRAPKLDWRCACMYGEWIMVLDGWPGAKVIFE